MTAARRMLLGVVAVAAAAMASAEEAALSWVALSGGCFAMGSDGHYREETPATERCVSAFEMLRTEVTNAQFARFVAETGYTTDAERPLAATDRFAGLPAGSAVFVVPETVDHETLNWWRFTAGASWRKPHGPDGPDANPAAPVVHITRRDAQAFAGWAGGRLPTEKEWEFAARGQTASDAKSAANTWQGLFPVIDSGRDGHIGIAPAGSFAANAQGLHDMLGNVWELTVTPYAPSHETKAIEIAGARGFDPAQPAAEVFVIKGGSYLCASDYCLRFRPAARQAQDAQLSTSHVGFRLVRSTGLE